MNLIIIDNYILTFSAMFTAIATVGLFIVSLFVKNDILKQQLEAKWGYHQNLLSFIRHLKNLILNNQNNYQPVLLRLSENEYHAYNNDLPTAQSLAKLANDFYHYFESMPNQVPPFINHEKNKEWKIAIQELQEYLLIFSTIDVPQPYSKWAEKSDIETNIEKLKKIFQIIETQIKITHGLS